jgi:hypothetical protein
VEASFLDAVHPKYGCLELHVRRGLSRSIKLRLTESHVALKLALKTFEAETTNVELLAAFFVQLLLLDVEHRRTIEIRRVARMRSDNCDRAAISSKIFRLRINISRTIHFAANASLIMKDGAAFSVS